MKKPLIFIVFAMFLTYPSTIFTMKKSIDLHEAPQPPGLSGLKPLPGLQPLDLVVEVADVDVQTDEVARSRVQRSIPCTAEAAIRIDRLEELEDLEESKVEEMVDEDYLHEIVSSRGIGDNLEDGYLKEVCSQLFQKNIKLRKRIKRRRIFKKKKKSGLLGSILGDEDEQDDPGLKKKWFVRKFMDLLLEDHKVQKDRGDIQEARAEGERERAERATSTTKKLGIVQILSSVAAVLLPPLVSGLISYFTKDS